MLATVKAQRVNFDLWNAELGVAPNSIGFGVYEFNRHTDDGDLKAPTPANYIQAYREVEEGPELAAIVANLIKGCATRMNDWQCFYSAPCMRVGPAWSNSELANGYWGLLNFQPQDPVRNTTHMWDAVVAAAQNVNNSTGGGS